MRLLLVFAVGCYSPSIAEQVPCTDTCPNGQRCVNGFCYTHPPIDAPIDGPPDAPPPDAFNCQGIDSVTNSPCVNQVSHNGFYFDLVAKKHVGITGFSIMAQSAGSRNMAIYYRMSSSIGHEGDPGGWMLLGTAANFSPNTALACPIPTTLIPTAFCLEMDAGDRHGFYIVTTSGTGTIEGFTKPRGQVVVEDGTLQIIAGQMQDGDGLFGGTLVDNLGFQGVVHTSD